MAVSFANATVLDVPSAPTSPLANRFQPLAGLPHDEETTKPRSKFQAQGVYKPPHMRIPSESVASTTGSDPMASSTSGVRPAHSSGLDSDQKGTSRPHTPHVSPASGSAVFGFSEMKKKIHEEILNVRKAMEEMEVIEKEFLKEEACFEQELQVLRNVGLTDEEIGGMMGWSSANLPPELPSVKLLDANGLGIDLARINPGSEREVEPPEKTYEKQPMQQTGEDLTNKTPTPGGPMYSTVNHPEGIHQIGKYGHSTPSATPANNAHHDTSVRQATGWNDQIQAHLGVTSCHGSIHPEAFQVSGQIYQTTPWKKFSPFAKSVPPRFRQPPIYHQPVSLHYQNLIPNISGDTFPVGHPVSWPPVPNQPQNSTQNHTFRPASMPPPPRPYFYEVDFVFDFEGVALSSNCNRDHFVKTYCKMNGFSPSQAAWAAWASAVEKVKRAQQDEFRRVMEQETKERYGTGSRLPKWCSKLLEDPPGSELGYSSSSSEASTKVESSRNSEVGDRENMVVSVVGKREIGVPRVQKRWKDVTDKTWAFGEPSRLDDQEHYMTHVVEKMGWQVHDPRPERLF